MDEIFFDDLKVGQRFEIPAKTITDAHFLFFVGLTGDNHPMHYDDEYSKNTIFGKKVAHGLLVMSLTALGASNLSFAVKNSMLAFLEQFCRFLKPVFVGDTLSPYLEVSELNPKEDKGIVTFKSAVVNQKGEVVLEGYHKYLMKRKKDFANQE